MRSQLGMGMLVLTLLGLAGLATILEVRVPDEQEGAVEARARIRLEFIDKLESCLADWEEEKATLRQTVTGIKDHCEVFYPDFLNNVSDVEAGATMEEKIARNLIRHYQALGTLEDLDLAPLARKMAERLHVEFQSEYGPY